MNETLRQFDAYITRRMETLLQKGVILTILSIPNQGVEVLPTVVFRPYPSVHVPTRKPLSEVHFNLSASLSDSTPSTAK
jgi:hypothetical protein